MWSFCKIKFTSKFVAIVGGWFPRFLHETRRLNQCQPPYTPLRKKHGPTKNQKFGRWCSKGPTPQLLRCLEAPKERFWQGSNNIWVNANFLRCCAEHSEWRAWFKQTTKGHSWWPQEWPFWIIHPFYVQLVAGNFVQKGTLCHVWQCWKTRLIIRKFR